MVQGTFIISKIREQHVLGATSGTYTVDLPVSNYLQSLNLRLQNVNGSTSNTAETIADSIDKLELVADGVTIYSVTGEMARSIEHFDIKHLPPYDEHQGPSKVQHATFPIKFGRDRNDKEVILPCHMFTTLQLKVTWSMTDSTTVGWTSSATNAKLDLIARYLVSDERVSTPFLKKLESYSKTLNTLQEEEISLATGGGNGAYRRLFVKAYEAGIEDGVDVDKYSLILNDSQYLISERWDTSQAEDDMRYGADGSKAWAAFPAAASGGTDNSKVSRIRSVSCSGSVADELINVDALAGDLVSYENEGTSASVAYVHVDAPGVPFCTAIDLGTDDINDSLDVGDGSNITSLKLRLNVAATGALVKVVSEQLVLF